MRIGRDSQQKSRRGAGMRQATEGNKNNGGRGQCRGVEGEKRYA